MDAYRRGEEFLVHFDLPGVDPNAIDGTVPRRVYGGRPAGLPPLFRPRELLTPFLDQVLALRQHTADRRADQKNQTGKGSGEAVAHGNAAVAAKPERAAGEGGDRVQKG